MVNCFLSTVVQRERPHENHTNLLQLRHHRILPPLLPGANETAGSHIKMDEMMSLLPAVRIYSLWIHTLIHHYKTKMITICTNSQPLTSRERLLLQAFLPNICRLDLYYIAAATIIFCAPILIEFKGYSSHSFLSKPLNT